MSMSQVLATNPGAETETLRSPSGRDWTIITQTDGAVFAQSDCGVVAGYPGKFFAGTYRDDPGGLKLFQTRTLQEATAVLEQLKG